MKLNLGCGQNKLEGFVNIDKYPTFNPDLIFDLEQTPWPFADGEVTEIVAFHALEHMGQDTATFGRILQELYRVMAPNAVMHIAVPHHRSEAFSGDPTHVRPITIGLMTLLSKKNCRLWGAEGSANTPLADYLDIDFELDAAEVKLMPYWSKKRDAENMSNDEINLALEMFNNVAEEVRFRIRKV